MSKTTLTVGKSDDTRAVTSVEGKSSVEADNSENMATARLHGSELAQLSSEPTLTEGMSCQFSIQVYLNVLF